MQQVPFKSLSLPSIMFAPYLGPKKIKIIKYI